MISFIIVNYNTKEITLNCIESILNNKKNNSNFEIIVVDNNSTDNSVEYLNQVYHYEDKVLIIPSSVNLGFGRANNLGADLSNGNILIFLNSDTIVNETDFSILLNQFTLKENIGFLSAKILNENHTIQSIGYKQPNIINEFKTNILFWNFNSIKKIRLKNYNEIGLRRVGWVSGCFMICKKDDFVNVEGFDPEIFMYSEDLDICLRMNKLNKNNYVYDKTSIYHLHGKSSNNKNLLKKLYTQKKNYFYVLKKNNFNNIFIIKLFTIYHITLLSLLKQFQKTIMNFYRKLGVSK